MTALSTTNRFALSPTVRDTLSADRARGHVHVMSAFRQGLGAQPRAAVGVLWHLDDRRGELTVRSTDAPLRPEILGAPIGAESSPDVGVGDLVEIRLSLNCQKTPSSDVPIELRPALQAGKCYRSRLVIVPEDERSEWARRRLSRAGLDLDARSVQIGPLRFARLGDRRRGIPYVELTGTARVTDPATLNDILATGLGKGKNYGLGLLQLRPLPSDE